VLSEARGGEWFVASTEHQGNTAEPAAPKAGGFFVFRGVVRTTLALTKMQQEIRRQGDQEVFFAKDKQKDS
jgi:hypothetical protein